MLQASPGRHHKRGLHQNQSYYHLTQEKLHGRRLQDQGLVYYNPGDGLTSQRVSGHLSLHTTSIQIIRSGNRRVHLVSAAERAHNLQVYHIR
jgi:hypothetical protein